MIDPASPNPRAEGADAEFETIKAKIVSAL